MLGYMVDVMATWIPWASANEYMHKIKNNNDAPYQWHFDFIGKEAKAKYL
jgi:hypothetical protein